MSLLSAKREIRVCRVSHGLLERNENEEDRNDLYTCRLMWTGIPVSQHASALDLWDGLCTE